MNTYQLLMLLIISAFYVTYLVKQILLKRKGIEGARLAKGNKPGKTYRIESLLLVSTYTFAVIQYASILLEDKLTLLIRLQAARAAGVFIALAGWCFFISAVAIMKDSWRAGVEEDQKTRIVTKGVYRISRNPAFTGFDLLYLGTALTFSNIVCIVGAIAVIVLLHMQILEEEKLLPRIFGPEYKEYKRRTRRYL
jgi:protein-S-isoprenylcysteine O-methyltransferase Ste14